MKRCIIVGAGDNSGTYFSKNDYDILIAADGGLKVIEKLGFSPDLIMGDFDSLGYAPEGDNVIRFKVEKDVTDMMIAVNKAIECGCTEITIFGGTGMRPDHTFANISTMLYASKKDVNIRMVDKSYIYYVITNDEITIKGEEGKDLSVFALDSQVEITIRGALYEVENAVLKNDMTLGVSNSFLKDKANIISKGSILIIEQK